MDFDYFYNREAERFNFLKVSEILVDGEEFKGLSAEAIILYSMLLKRTGIGSKFSYIASEVNKRLFGNGSSSGGASTSSLYRVRKSWGDAKSQKGAFRSFENAKKCVNSNPGYKVFDAKGSEVYPRKSNSSKSIDTLAREVIAGNWGNGQDRVNRLKSAGYDYDAVQNRVNEILYGKSSSHSGGKSINTLAREVIRGDWGNGQDRKNRLERADYDYNAVQRRVNELL